MAAAGSKDLDAAPLLLTTQDQVEQTVAGRGRLRRLARRDRRRRGGAALMRRGRRRDDRRGPADRARARLLPRLDDRGAAPDRRRAGRGDRRRRRDRREERAGQRRRDRDQRAARRGRRPARGPARQEGRPERRDGPDRGRLPGRRRGRAAQLPREHRRSTRPRIGEVYTKGTLTLARLGREAPIAAASPAGEVLRNVEGGSLAARLLYPNVRHDEPGEPAALAGDRHRRPGPVRAARRHRGASQAAPGRRT